MRLDTETQGGRRFLLDATRDTETHGGRRLLLDATRDSETHFSIKLEVTRRLLLDATRDTETHFSIKLEVTRRLLLDGRLETETHSGRRFLLDATSPTKACPFECFFCPASLGKKNVSRTG